MSHVTHMNVPDPHEYARARKRLLLHTEATHYRAFLPWDAYLCCSVLQCVAVCCSVLQCVAVCCSVLQYTLQTPTSVRTCTQETLARTSEK